MKGHMAYKVVRPNQQIIFLYLLNIFNDNSENPTINTITYTHLSAY